MTTININKLLLEQALNALLLPCDRWNKQQFLIVKGAIESLNAALVAPAAAPGLSAAYIGAREDLAIWKKRALEAEETARQLNRALAEEVNGPTFMGEPVLPATASAQPEIVDLLAEKSGGVWTWPDRAIEAVRKHRSGPAQPERTPTTRKAFEAHIRKKFPTAKEELLFSRSSIGRYRSIATEDAWLAWQAATAAALERAAEVCEAIENGEKPDGSIAAGLSWECADAIRALKEQQ